MRGLLVLTLLVAVAIGGWIGYRATQPQRHCTTIAGHWDPDIFKRTPDRVVCHR